jgi:hypothetical protein
MDQTKQTTPQNVHMSERKTTNAYDKYIRITIISFTVPENSALCVNIVSYYQYTR